MVTPQVETKSRSVNGFDRFPLSDPLRQAIRMAGFTEPRPIQEAAIEPVLNGFDVLGLAQTGTGKTAAFALPILERILENPGRGPRVLIVAPTRELVLQIEAEIRVFAQKTRIETVTIFGGISERPQIAKLRKKPEIVIACPGRLLDLLGQGALSLRGVETLVLDEADHMFDMGFLPDVRRILSACPDDRQNLMFSATMPAEIRSLADQILNEPEVIELAHSLPAETIEHALYPVPEKRKQDLLEHLIEADGIVSAIVFTRTKHRAKRLAQKFEPSEVQRDRSTGKHVPGAA